MAEKQGFNIGEFIQKNFVVILAFIAFILWYTKKPNNSEGKLLNSDTVRTQVVQPIVINPAYTPTQSGSTVYVPIPQQYQPVTPANTTEGLVNQVKELSDRVEYLAKEYYASKNYRDSIQLKDSSGKRVGVVNLNQTVSENTLKSIQSSYQLAFPVTTITNTVQAKLRNQVFFGASVQSPIASPRVEQVNLGLLFKNKREDVLSLSGTYNIQTGQPGAQLGYYKKLSFKIFGR